MLNGRLCRGIKKGLVDGQKLDFVGDGKGRCCEQLGDVLVDDQKYYHNVDFVDNLEDLTEK